jgi:hypothetical protein
MALGGCRYGTGIVVVDNADRLMLCHQITKTVGVTSLMDSYLEKRLTVEVVVASGGDLICV